MVRALRRLYSPQWNPIRSAVRLCTLWLGLVPACVLAFEWVHDAGRPKLGHTVIDQHAYLCVVLSGALWDLLQTSSS
jgi:hypothetical protein